MSESAQAPADSSNGSPSPPSDSPPAKNDSQPLDTPPSPVVDGSLPPSNAEKTPSLPDQSSSSPPPTESTPSPPPPTLSPPPPSPSDSSPPLPSSDLKTPPEPNSPPPKASPPSNSKSSSPPPPKESSSEAPSGSVIVPPPASQSPPSENPANPPPAISSGSPSKPPSPPPAQPNAPSTPETPQIIIPPQVPGSPPAPITQDPLPLIPSVPSAPISSIPGSNPSPKSASPSREHGGHDSSTPDQSSPSTKTSGNSSSGSVAGVAVAGVVIIALVAVFFVISRKRKRKGKAYYIAPPDNFSVQTEGYYYGQQHAMPVSGQHSHEFYSGKLPLQSGNGATFGSSGAGHTYNFSGPESGVFGTKSSFGYEELMEITNGFSRENILGEGGFGCVYKGWLPDGRVVAVKQLKAGSGQGEREFRAEVEIISRVHHRHLVSLVGYCIAEYHRLLVYEFVPNNNLEHHLHGNGMPPLEWSKRMKIAVGSARGLAYLHEDCHPKIIHRDIKSANILLDDAFEAQVADFGLAKLSNDMNSHVSTRVMGTFGYMAPEYASSGKLTDRSDVYSFGVVLLELITGRKPIDASQDESLVEWARPLLIQALETGDMSALIDPRLEKRYVESEMFRMIETAAACVRHSAPKRPRMVQVVRALDTDGDMPDLTNGVKVGQSTIFGTANSEIQRFQRMAFGSGESSDYDIYSGEFREVPLSSSTSGKPGESNTSAELPSGELESRPMNPRVGSRRI